MVSSSEEDTDDDEPTTHVKIALPHKLVRHGFAHSTDRTHRKTTWIVPVKYAKPTDRDYSRPHPARYESPDPEFEMFIDLGKRRLVSDTVDVRWLYPDYAGHLAYIVKTPENNYPRSRRNITSGTKSAGKSHCTDETLAGYWRTKVPAADAQLFTQEHLVNHGVHTLAENAIRSRLDSNDGRTITILREHGLPDGYQPMMKRKKARASVKGQPRLETCKRLR